MNKSIILQCQNSDKTDLSDNFALAWVILGADGSFRQSQWTPSDQPSIKENLNELVWARRFVVNGKHKARDFKLELVKIDADLVERWSYKAMQFASGGNAFIIGIDINLKDGSKITVLRSGNVTHYPGVK